MKQFYFTSCFLFCFVLMYCQETAGVYIGDLMSDSVNIHADFSIKADSSYKIILTSNFKEYCVGKDTSEWTFEGNWKRIEDWLFLYPYNKGVSIFYQYIKRTRKDKKLIARYSKDNSLALKISFEEEHCPRIYFKINAECFKEVWKYYYIEKQCK